MAFSLFHTREWVPTQPFVKSNREYRSEESAVWTGIVERTCQQELVMTGKDNSVELSQPPNGFDDACKNEKERNTTQITQNQFSI